MRRDFRYTASGLQNVVIRNMEVVVDDEGCEVYTIPNILGVHKVIAHAIITKKHGLTPAELRFLRGEIELTQAELGRLVKVDHQTVGRWERGETPIDQNAEFVIRLVAAEMLKIDPKLSSKEIAERCVPSAVMEQIEIDGTDPDDYQLVRAA
jgi:DNA-binding transcriptional regulator YiaG